VQDASSHPENHDEPFRKKEPILLGFEAGTVDAAASGGASSFLMTIEEWEAVSATLLWINLKSGMLPL